MSLNSYKLSDYMSFCNIDSIKDVKYSKIDKKEGILLIDDSPGIISFLEDDFSQFFSEKILDENNYNLFSFYGRTAIFDLINNLKFKDLNIKYAVIDLTFGGILKNKNGENIKLTGVDVYIMLKELKPSLKFCFLTGNQMNTYIDTIKNMCSQFYRYNRDDIMNYVVFKNSNTIKNRRKEILKRLFDIDIKY